MNFTVIEYINSDCKQFLNYYINIKKLIIKLTGKKQQTINIKRLLQQGLDPDQVEDAVSRKLNELEDSIVSVEFVLNVQSIADTVQPETDRLLGKL